MTEFTSKYQSQRNFLKSRGSDSNRLYLSATIPLSIPRQKFWEGAMAFPNRTAPPSVCWKLVLQPFPGNQDATLK